MRHLLILPLFACIICSSPAHADTDIYVDYYEIREEDSLTGRVNVMLEYYSTLTVKKIENAIIEITNYGFEDSILTIYEARGENSFKATYGSGNPSYLNFQGTMGPGAVFNFGDNGQGSLSVGYNDIAGGGAAETATVINFHSDAELIQNQGGAAAGFVDFNFEGSAFQPFRGFYNFGQADMDSRLTIGGKSSAASVGIVKIHGGRGDKITGVVVGSTDDGSHDFHFHTENYVKGGNFAFYYNGTKSAQGGDGELSIGTPDDDTKVILGGTNSAAAVRLGNLIGGENGCYTTVIVDGAPAMRAMIAQNNLNIINNNKAEGSAVLENMGDGVLNLGGGGSPVFLKWINSIDKGLFINSLDKAAPAAAELGRLETQSGVDNRAKITLGNASLIVADDGSGLNYTSGGSRFMMDSREGPSRLDASKVAGDFAFAPGQEPTLKVGRGGDVIIESNNLVYQGALKNSPGGQGGFDGLADFSEAGENRLIFHGQGQNSFQGGMLIDDSRANIEFAGSSLLEGFTDKGEESRLNAGHIWFTGLGSEEDPLSASRISLAGGIIDMGKSTLHLNNSLFLSPDSDRPGGLGPVSSLVMGDGKGFSGGSPLSLTLFENSLSADEASVGPAGARINAPVAIGGVSALPDSLNIGKTLSIGGPATINGHLGTLAAGDEPAFYFTANESIRLTEAARFSYIDPGTIFMIDPALAGLLKESGENFTVFEAEEGSGSVSPSLLATLAANLIFSDENLGELAGYFSFDPFSVTLQSGREGALPRPIPPYAASMVEAARGHNPILAQYLARGPDLTPSRHYLELAQVMGNTMNAALNLPLSAGYAMRRLGQAAALAGTLPVRGNPAERITDGLWMNTHLGRTDIDGDYQEGASGAESESRGLVFGYDLEAKSWLRAGVFAGLDSSETEMDWQTIESESMEAGVYGQVALPLGFIMNAAASYAWQEHKSSREIDLRGALGENFRQNLSADFGGDSINFQAELKHPLDFGGRFQISPGLGYKHQTLILEPFMETSTLHASPQYDLSTIAAGGEFETRQLKAGADIAYKGPALALSASAYLLRNIGDLRPQSQAFFAHSAAPKAFDIYGAELDEEMVSLSLGLAYSPGGRKGGPAISLNYEALLGSGTESHGLNLSLGYNF